MSRSYRKTGAYAIAGGSDKWNRTRYHRDERRKVKRLLHEQLAYGTSIWKPVEGPCCLYGDVCNVDDWWCDDPSKYIINYEEDSTPKEDFDHDCFMCRFSYWDKDYDWSEEPWEKIVMNKVDRTIPSGDKYGWSTDGGAYWQDDLSTIRQEFDKGLFGEPEYSWRSRRIPYEAWNRYVENRKAMYNKKHPTMRVCCEYSKPKKDHWLEWAKKCNIAFGDAYDYYTRVFEVPYRKYHKIDAELVFEGLEEGMKLISCKVYKSKDYWKRMIRNPRFDVIDFAIMIAPTTLHGPKDFTEWMRAHQEEIIKNHFKYRYRK